MLDAKTALRGHINLLAELADHYDPRFERITHFGYSEELADWMHENEIQDPNNAFAVLADDLRDDADMIAAVSQPV